MAERVYVALGSNLGDRAGHLAHARARLAALPRTQLVRASRVEETAPLGPIAQGPYLNQMVLLETELEPVELLRHLHAIEAERGRVRTVRWGPRTLDLDVVRYGERTVRQPELTIPHPELPHRDFWRREIAELTCYDALFARLLDASGVDILLVGDSVNQVLAGAETTLSATLEQMIYHTKIVRRGAQRAMVVCDLPFLSYQVSPQDAIRNAGRVLQETGCHAVKLEGGRPMAETVRALVEIGIPVMGHLGLTPQSVHALGGYRVQGRDEPTAERLKGDARALEEAGAFSLVLELVPAPLASQITKALTIPTIGIGAGPACDGQVLVLHDMLGLNEEFAAKFVKRYAALAEDVREAVRLFAAEVREGRYPGPEHSFPK